MIGLFVNNKFRITHRNCHFQEFYQEHISRIVFNEDIKQSIVRNEVITATDDSVKDGNIECVWKIE